MRQPLKSPPSYCLASLLVLLSLFLTLAIGCQRSEFAIAPVSGQVTLDGEPLAGVHVLFQPRAKEKKTLRAGPGSTGTTDREGRYELTTVEPTFSGAVVGEHIVRLSTNKSSMLPPSELAELSEDPFGPRIPSPSDLELPPEWKDGSKRYEVPPEGTDQANFTITTE